MRRLSFLVVLALAVPAWSAPFKIDLDRADVRAHLGLFTIEDLTVGETGIVIFPSFCELDGNLMINAAGILNDGTNDYSMNYRVTRQPGGTVSIASSPGDKSNRTSKETVGLYFIDHRNCLDNDAPLSLLPVSTIDGASSLSEILSAQ